MYDPGRWKDHGSYYTYEDSQRTIGWKQARMGRVTGSIISSCIGNTEYFNQETPEDIAKQIAGIKDKQFTPEAQARMDYGTIHESDARNWYALSYTLVNSSKDQVRVIEKEFAVPKFDPRIGMSPDGMVIINEVEVGLIEIKCPQSFYRSLDIYLRNGRPRTSRYEHIYRSHYDQMQMGMAIFDKEWCDYIVYCIPENKVFLERVYRNRDYWDDIYRRVKIFIENILTPILVSTGSRYPLVPLK